MPLLPLRIERQPVLETGHVDGVVQDVVVAVASGSPSRKGASSRNR